MDSGFLEEYERREFEAFERNENVSERIDELKPPIFNITGPCSSIWSQIAFSGTVIFPLHPLRQETFESGWHISTTEFPDLIQFVKETKKIQFVLTAPPTAYKEFDYLEPILTELKPPMYTQIGRENQELRDLASKCNSEINYLISLSPSWKFRAQFISTQRHIINDYINCYTMLRYLGFKEIADTFVDNFLADPKFSEIYIATAFDLLVHPLIDPFKANLSFCIDKIQKAKEMGINTHLSSKDASFPEVGSYLMTKCTPYPESLHACRNLIDDYQENDLFEVYAALNNAIIDKNDTSILQRTDEIKVILDNVWNDTTIKSNATAYYYGINITCGVIGYCLKDAPGLLVSLGLKVLDCSKSKYLDQFSELISKRTASPYMATIYDFKKEYGR